MKTIEFNDKKAQNLYQSYLKQVARVLEKTDLLFKSQMIMEINNHIFEGLSFHSSGDEYENLRLILSELGEPKDYLRDVLEEHKLDRALKKFNFLGIITQLFHFGTSSVKYTIYFFLYSFLLIFIFCIPALIVSKIKNPHETGLFIKRGVFFYFGTADSKEVQAYEVLGYWFIPVVILLFAVLFCVLTLLLRFSRKRRKQKMGLSFLN